MGSERMTVREVADLRRRLATRHTLPEAEVARALAELELLVGEQAQVRHLLDEATGPWAEVRRVLGEIADAFDDSPTVNRPGWPETFAPRP